MSSIELFEVGPRDGLQNEKRPIEMADKFEFIKLLSKTGLKNIEVSSFVSPKAIPQLADAAELVPKVLKELPKLNYPVLAPNEKGLDHAISAGIKEIAVFMGVSESFNLKNINMTPSESLKIFKSVINRASENGIRVRGYLSTVFGCPYEGKVAEEKVKEYVEGLLNLGVYQVSLGDTIGVASPGQVRSILQSLSPFKSKLAMHFHNTYGTAIVNVKESLDSGIRTFDASAGGLGGCPYAEGASGNVATEEVIRLIHSLGGVTGVDLDRVNIASKFILSKLGKNSSSQYVNKLIKGEFQWD